MSSLLFSEMRYGAGLSGDDEALADRLRSLAPERAQALLQSIVAEEAGRILRLPAADVDPARPLSQMGMDSLMAVELRLALESRLRIDLPLVALAEGTSVVSIAARLGSALAPAAENAQIAALAARHETFDTVVAATDTKAVAASTAAAAD